MPVAAHGQLDVSSNRAWARLALPCDIRNAVGEVMW